VTRHSDFEKIFLAFIKRYGQVEGEKNYFAWLVTMNLDDTKSYSSPQESLGKERFNWAKVLFSYLREDTTKKYFKVEASFPLSSMNNVVYTEDELRLGARSLVGKPVNLNHDGKALGSVSIEGAEYEDDAVECVLGILKGSDVLAMVEKGEIFQVSTEASCLQGMEPTDEGDVCKGLVYTGLGLLTKTGILPGVPLTRIMPAERIVESFQVMLNGGEKLGENDKGKTEESKVVDEKVGNERAAAPSQDKKPETPKPVEIVVIAKPKESDMYKCPKCGYVASYYDWQANNWLCKGVGCGAEVVPPEPEVLALRQATAAVPESKPTTLKEKKTPCEEAKEALLVRVSALEGKVKVIETDIAIEEAVRRKEQKDLEDKAAAEKKAAEAKRSERPSVLTKEGFWARFHELRKEGASKTDAFRLVSMEVIEASSKQ